MSGHSAWEAIKKQEHKNPWAKEDTMTGHQREVYTDLCKNNPDVSEHDFIEKYHEFWDETGKPREV